ncbi:phage major capsid protein [Brucella pseudogrignonensis]|uniref:Phage major capsid protein n=1 Tax=Brucella pseudogrignonensis TaxID=419475 RepID=A0A7Y3T1Q2_9HYPH|nr:phage major capsid protein [Brucella pseudogrignonensis]EMG52661.1 phage major capsid protein, HK97 family [Ochrobactrum sp. CDB2]MCM0752870.1 phage major capsid protein [Brucella pseudogrignonensis]NNV19446.1 phage major capsid protein [Brucella pseudogrignonensis]
MADNVLADKIGELGTSLASIKEQVGNLAVDFTSKLAATGEVSAELKEKTDKALSELGDMTTRLGDLEKRAAREKEEGANEQKSLGDLVIDSADYKAGMLTGSSRGSIKVTADRAAITSANTTVGAGRSQGTSLVPGARVPGIFGLPERTLTIRDLVLPGQTASSSIEYVKETGYTNNAAPVAETTAKPYSDLTFDMTSAPVRTIAHLFKASRQILDDAPALRSYIDGRARYGLRFAEENQLLNGSGTGQNIHGLVPQATAFNPAFAAENETGIDRLRLAILQVVLAEYPATAFVLNPIDWAKIELTKDLGGNYIIGNPQGSLTPTLWNLPVVSTQAMAAGEFLTGAFSFAAQIFDRLDIEVLLSSENVDDFEKNMFTIRAEERLAFAVYRPESFVTGEVEGA